MRALYKNRVMSNLFLDFEEKMYEARYLSTELRRFYVLSALVVRYPILQSRQVQDFVAAVMTIYETYREDFFLEDDGVIPIGVPEAPSEIDLYASIDGFFNNTEASDLEDSDYIPSEDEYDPENK